MFYRITASLILASMLITSCSSGGGGSSSKAAAEGSYPSPGTSGDTVGAPSGTDAFSASTNRSSKDDETSAKPDPFAGAAFVRPPDINNYGAVSLAYAIETIPGRAGMQPSVGLSYSSSGGDGLCGIGWNLSTGFGVISRTTRVGQLYYDYRDEFTYNGSRLVKVSGPATSEEGTYRLEIESAFTRFELTDTATGGVWRVTDSSGTVTFYGQTVNERIYHPADNSKTYIWNFSRSEDLRGNYMAAEYDRSSYGEDNISYLETIHYTGNSHESHAPERFVKFEYGERPSGESYTTTAAGFPMSINRILEKISTGAGSETLWYYEPVYTISADSSRPVMQTVKSSRTVTEPEFIYQPASHTLAWQKIPNPYYSDFESSPADTKFFEGDFNGDGQSDMLVYNPANGSFKAAEANRNGSYDFKTYASDVRFAGLKGQRVKWLMGSGVGDYTGNGKSDIAFYVTQTKTFWVATFKDGAFNFVNYGTLPHEIDPFSMESFPGDYDGNGLSDIMLFDEQSGNWIVMYNRGDRFDFIKVAENLKNLFRFDYTPDASLNSQSTHDTLPEGSHRGMVRFFVGDYSANGRSDIAFYDERSKSFFVADVSRDEQERIRMSWRLLKRFTVPESAIFSNENFSGDFNGDGYSDFIFFDRDAGEWIAGFTDANTINFKKYGTTPAFKNITRFLQGDFNGDGRTDIGFYCHDDGNFWIGEGAPEGFRFRIYNNITYGGPDRARVMATPHPKEGVREGAYSGFDGHNNRVVRTTLNTNERSGLETLFTIASETSSAVIIYDSKTNTFSYKKENRNTAVSVIKPESDVVFPYNHAVRMDGDKTGLIYYTVSSSVNADKIYNYHILHDASGNLTSSPIASFDQSEIGFDPQSSLVNWGKFGGEYALAFLNDRVDEYEDVTIRLYKLDVDSFDEFTVSGNSAAGELVKEDLVNISQNPSVALFASGGLTSDDALVISGINNRIYAVAGFNTGDAVFAPVSEEDFTVNSTGLVSSRSTTNGLAVVTQNESMYSVTRYIVNGTTKTFESKEVIDKPVTDNFFAGFTSDGLAVFQSGDIFVISAVSADTPIDETQANNLRVLERDDFITRAYPFAWKQGDYNGDGKTDIGIFDLKETHFYFARTTGTVPDLLSQVKNGIGGSYYMEYANSTSFDNTGDDDVPDLGVNYKVCTSLRVEDGEGHSVKTRYEYAGGFAFSEFINGRKEVDYFGFSDFKKISAYGAVEHTEYHTTPYDDFRKNRALAGAVKRSSFKGSDGVLYKETEHEYRLHTITPSGFIEPASYIVVPSAVKTWSEGVHVLTDEVELELGEEYSLKRRVSRSTDHYSDDLRSPVTTENITEYEYIESTNENREIKTISMPGTDFETVTSVVYNYEGLPELNQVSYTGGTLDKPSDQVVYYEYDSYGNMIREENRSDSPYRVSEITYDSRFKTFPEQSRVLADGSKWLTENSEYNYDFAFGQMKQKTDANGNRTRFEYDQQGRLSRQYADTDDGEKLFNEYNYSDGTYPMWVKTVQHSGTDDPARISTVYADGTGRVIHSVRSASDGAAVRSGRISYDAEGRVTRKGQSYWTDRGELDRFSRPSDEINPTLYSYDGAGRVKRVTLPQSEDESEPYYTETEYNGPYETVQKNSRGYSKTTRTNGLGLVLSVIESGTGDDGVARNASIGFAYDAAGRRIKKMDTNGRAMNVQVDNSLFAQGKKDQSGANICQWKYDGFGRVIESSDADLGYSSTVYNAFGDTRSVTTARGLTTSYQYDRLGRVTKEILSGDEGEVEYVYDEAVNGKGKLSQVTSPAMTKLFAYDKLGRVKTETRTISNNGGTYTNDYAYDLFNRHHTITYPSDPVNGERLRVNYSYNEDGIDSVSYVLGSEKRTVISDIKYNEFGQQSRVTRGNNTRTEYIYDIKGRLKKLTSLAKDNGYDYAVQNVRYDFNSDNSIASVENSPELAFTGLMDGTIRHDYMYDGLNRLITAEGEVRINDHEAEYYKREFAYSPNGNLLTKKMMDRGTKTDSANWSYTYKNHAVASVTQNGMPVFNMSYDASGNMTSQIDNHRDMIKNIAYDSKNRMISVTDKNGNTVGNYEYDEQGFRVRKTARAEGEGGDKTVEILYPSMYHGIERTKATARSTSDSDSYAVNNIYVNGIRIAAVSGDGAERHYFTDQVDSVKLVMDGDGKPIKAFEYLPYGETWLQKGESNDKPKYNSQELDDETGYYYYNARHYDAALARFVTADTVVDGEYSVAGWNRYMYCAGNPVLYKDPTGHSWQTMQQEFRKGILDSQDIDSRLQTEQKAFDLERTGADCVDSLESKLHDNRVENGWKTEMQSGDKTALANYIDNVYSDSVPVWAYDGKEYNKVKLEYDENADQSVMNNNYRNTLKEALFCSGNMSATITSTYRNSYNQARVMYDNVRNRGLQSQYKLYGKSGDSVLDQYNSSLSRDKAILKMQKQIEQIENNGGWVSAHGGNYNIRGAFDISPLSLINKKAFSDQLIKMKNSGEIEKYILPSSSEPAYHIELKNK